MQDFGFSMRLAAETVEPLQEACEDFLVKVMQETVWSSFFEKCCKINDCKPDCEEDGLLPDELVDMFAQEELNPGDEIDEPDVYVSEDEAIVDLIVEESDPRSRDQEQLTYYFAPEVLAALKKVFDRRAIRTLEAPTEAAN